MNRRLVVNPEVDANLAYYYSRIILDKPEPAERLLAVAGESFERLRETPELGRRYESPHPRLRKLRFYPMPSPYRAYLIFYQVTPETVDILSVVHGARDLDVVVRDMDF